MLSPMKNQVSSGRPVPVAEMSCTSISPIWTPLLASAGAAVITILTQLLPVKSSACARVRTWLPVTGAPAAAQVPSMPFVESDDTSKW